MHWPPGWSASTVVCVCVLRVCVCVFQVNAGLLQTVVTHLTVHHQGECVGVYCFAVKVFGCVCVCVVCASRCALSHCHSVCRCVAICVLESVTKSREWKYQ